MSRLKNRRKQKFNLRQFVLREARKLQREASHLSGKPEPIEKVKADEVDADGYAGTLEKDIDFIKALKIKEARLNRVHKKLAKEMRKLQENKRKLRKRVIRKI